MDNTELERRARHAYRLGETWLYPGSIVPRTSLTFEANPENPIMNVRFLPGSDGRWIVTVSQGIWSVLAFWHFPPNEPGKAVKVTEWMRKGAFFHAFVVNQDPDSEATVAVSVSLSQHRSDHHIDILQLRHNVYNDISSLRLVTSIETSHLPIALRGDVLAMSDRAFETRILNWKNGGEAVLRDREETELASWQYNRCLQVVFARESVLVVRARSVSLFPEPGLQKSQNIRIYDPIASHSFGWIDAVAVNALHPHPDKNSGDPLLNSAYRPLSILLREDSDDPWSPNSCTLTLFELSPDPTYISIHSDGAASPGRSPYLFPPVQKDRLATVRGFLRCNSLFLGKFGTVLWIQPREPGHLGLTALDLHSQEAQIAGPPPALESLMATVFPGPLARPEIGDKMAGTKVWTNDLRYWVSMDYDEEVGVVALGNQRGDITILRF